MFHCPCFFEILTLANLLVAEDFHQLESMREKFAEVMQRQQHQSNSMEAKGGNKTSQ